MKRRPKKDRSIILRIVILLVCGYFTVSLVNLWGQLDDAIKDLDGYKEEFSAEKNELEELRALVNAEDDTPIIEKALRERGYAYSDEQIFVDLSGN